MAKGYVGVTMSYTPVEYIESSGTQYIDTHIVPKSTVRFVADMSLTDLTITNRCGWGASGGAEAMGFGLGDGSQANFFGVCTSSNNYIQTATKDMNRHIFDVSNAGIKLDNVSYATGNIGNTAEAGQTIYLFGYHAEWETSGVQLAKHRMYSSQIYDNGVLVRDFIPVLDENNVACLYDLVEGKFYYNKGTGTFTAGSATGQPVSIGGKARTIKNAYVGVNSLLYTPIEYIESTGTQYIDTGFKPNQDTKIELDIQSTSNTTSNVFAGGRQAFQNKAYYISQQYGDGDNTGYRFAYGTETYDVPGTYQDVSRRLFVLNKNLAYFDNNLVKTFSTQTFTAPVPLWLFTGNNNGSIIQPAIVKLYSCKIWDNETLVRDFIPAKDRNGVAGLYEAVTGTFYYNQGTGTFTAGTEGTSVYAEVARKIKKGYVGDSNGVARLCFGSATPTYKMTVAGNANQKSQSMVAGVTDYILVAGGSQSGGTPVTTTIAYNINGVATNAANLPTRSHDGGATNFNEYAIIMGGKTASSGGSRTPQCIAYNNNLTNQTLSNLYDYVFAPASASTSEHFMVGGGCNYSSWLSSICAYDKSFIKTTPSNMSIRRDNNSLAAIDQYIVCCGGHNTYGAVDFYDNSNVKTTVTSPYSKATNHTLGLTTKSYAIFFSGGSDDSTPYADCKAYDKNKVLTSFTAPISMIRAQGFSNGEYACVFYNSNELIYDDNLVLVDNISGGSWSNVEGKMANANGSFGLVRPNGSASIYLFDV